jgi:hypothetical protein
VSPLSFHFLYIYGRPTDNKFKQLTCRLNLIFFYSTVSNGKNFKVYDAEMFIEKIRFACVPEP